MGKDDGEAPSAKDPPTKMFSRVDIGVDNEGVSEAPSCRYNGIGESSWFATTIGEDPPVKVFGGGEVGVDVEGVGKGPPAKLFGEGPPEKSCFGRGDVGEVTRDGGEARRQR